MIMGGNESYGRRASFWINLTASKDLPKNQKIKFGAEYSATIDLTWVAVARMGLKLGGNKATRFRILEKPILA